MLPLATRPARSGTALTAGNVARCARGRAATPTPRTCHRADRRLTSGTRTRTIPRSGCPGRVSRAVPARDRLLRSASRGRPPSRAPPAFCTRRRDAVSMQPVDPPVVAELVAVADHLERLAVLPPQLHLASVHTLDLVGQLVPPRQRPPVGCPGVDRPMAVRTSSTRSTRAGGTSSASRATDSGGFEAARPCYGGNRSGPLSCETTGE
jgi:hypothetical protein